MQIFWSDGLFIFTKTAKTVATTCGHVFWGQKYGKCVCCQRQGSTPDLAGEAYNVPPDSLVRFKGATSWQRWEGRGGHEGDGREGRKGEEGKGREWEGKKVKTVVAPMTQSLQNITVNILTMQLRYPSVDINPHTAPSAYRDTISPICSTYGESPILLERLDLHQSESVTHLLSDTSWRYTQLTPYRKLTRRSKPPSRTPHEACYCILMTTPISQRPGIKRVTDAIKSVNTTLTVYETVHHHHINATKITILLWHYHRCIPTLFLRNRKQLRTHRNERCSAGCGHAHPYSAHSALC